MFVGSIGKGISMEGYLKDGLLEPRTLHARHAELVAEMEKRGYNHRSPLPNVDTSHLRDGKISAARSIADLRQRCSECAKRIAKYENR